MMRTARRATGALLIALLGASAAAAPAPPGFILREEARPLPDVAMEDQAGATLRLQTSGGR
jgi:hypothetical protein